MLSLQLFTEATRLLKRDLRLSQRPVEQHFQRGSRNKAGHFLLRERPSHLHDEQEDLVMVA
jgi:hypothetical protein